PQPSDQRATEEKNEIEFRVCSSQRTVVPIDCGDRAIPRANPANSNRFGPSAIWLRGSSQIWRVSKVRGRVLRKTAQNPSLARLLVRPISRLRKNHQTDGETPPSLCGSIAANQSTAVLHVC